jgi:SAM-dependent methyltransferase
MKKALKAKQELFAGVVVPDDLRALRDRALKPCAICQSTDARRIYQQAHFPVVKCGGCGLIYADEHFKSEDLAQFYTGDYYQRAYVCHPPQIDAKIAGDYVREFRRIDRLQPAGGRVLDFGCARGTFLGALAASDMGRRWELDGVDINADEVGMGQARGQPVRVADVFSDAIPDAAYDAVTAFSVIEHMQDPRRTVEALRRILKPGGRFLAIVPNGECLIVALGRLVARLGGERFRSFTDNVFHEEHLYYFSPATLTRLLGELGFAVEQIGFQPSYLETHPPGPIVALPAWGLRLTSWILRRQTMLLCVARKPANAP